MLVGLTQRVEVVAKTREERDCLDQSWFKRLDDLNLSGIPVPNSLSNPVKWAKSIGIEGLILTGGNDLSHLNNAKNIALTRDLTETALLSWSSEKRVPVLGICRGMQLMNTFLGGYGNTTSAIDAIDFKMSSGNIDSGTIDMYGVN